MSKIHEAGQLVDNQFAEYLRNRPTAPTAYKFDTVAYANAEFERRVAEKPDPAHYPSY